MTLRRQHPFASATATTHHAPDLRLEPVHLAMRLAIDIDAKELRAELTHRVRANVAGARSLTLHAEEFVDLEVSSTNASDASSENVRHSYDGHRVQLVWEQPFAQGEEREVSLTYLVRAPRSGLFFSGDLDDPDCPTFAVTDHETERARYWLACVDLPSVRPTLDITLITAPHLTALANGRLHSETTEEGQKHTRWILDAPCPSYLTCFAVGEFAEWKDAAWKNGDSDLPIAAYAPEAMFSEADLARSFGRTRELIDWMEKRLDAKLPYPKYYQFAAPFIGGAMENISLVSWDARFVLDEAIAPERKALFDVINLHELAHTWFGDHIVCRDYAHAWLKESWATYLESCWLEEVEGEQEGVFDRYRAAKAYFGECKDRYIRPIVTRRFDTSWDMYDHHLYPGGAWRIHMLRRLIGDEVFWAATHDYVKTFGGKTVETSDFRRVMEKHSGRSLTAFFDDWLYRAGHPTLKVTFRHDLEAAEGTFTIEQMGAVENPGSKGKSGGTSGGHVFAFDLPIAWRPEGANGDFEQTTISLTSAKTQHVVPMATPPASLRIDPEQTVLHALQLDVGNALLRRMLEDTHLVTRIHAAHALAKGGRAADLHAVATALSKESFWGVQEEMIEALGNAPTAAAAEALAAQCRSHTEVRSFAALFNAAGKHRSPAIAEALRARLDGDLTPLARGAALKALGAQRDPADLPRLIAASKEGHAEAQLGALAGLGASTLAEARAPLQSALPFGAARSRVRPAAATALGALAPRLDRPAQRAIADALLEALKDPIGRVADAAASALVAMDATEAQDALLAYGATLATQNEHGLRRSIRALRSKGPSPLLTRVEKLEAELQKLKESKGSKRTE